jgi:hypothetical protein
VRSLILAAALTAATTSHALEFKPAMKIDLRGEYSNQQISAASHWDMPVDFFLVPAFDFGSGTTLAPVLAFLREGPTPNNIPEETSNLVETNTFLAKPILKKALNDSWALKAWGTAKRTVTKQSISDHWSLGLYDWEEFGGGVGVDWKTGLLGAEKLSLGAEGLHRGYPNWHESGVALSNNRNYYSKDYNGLKLNADLNSSAKQRLSWDSGVMWLLKGYTDALLIAQDGTFDQDVLRSDSLLRWDLNSRYALNERWDLRASYDLDWNSSNQNFFDGAFNQPVMDFYSYLSNGVVLGLGWKSAGQTHVDLSAGLTNRVYSGRSIRNPDGTYTQGVQADVEQTYALDGSCPVKWVPGLDLVSGVSWFFANSNQGYEGTLRSTYDIFKANLGVTYRL